MDKSEDPTEWFEFALRDLESAELLSQRVHRTPVEVVCYLCQQCAEKALKGFLLHCKVKPKRIHDLTELRSACSAINADFAEVENDCARLTVFATEARYPGGLDIPKYEMQRATKMAKRVYEYALAQAQSNKA